MALSVDESDLFLAFHSDFNMSGFNWLGCSEIDASSDHFPWVIIGFGCLHAQVTLVVPASGVVIAHKIFAFNKLFN